MARSSSPTCLVSLLPCRRGLGLCQKEGGPGEIGGKPCRIQRLDRLDLFLKEGIQEKLEGSLAEFGVWIVWIPSLIKNFVSIFSFLKKKGSKRSNRRILQGFLQISLGSLLSGKDPNDPSVEFCAAFFQFLLGPFFQEEVQMIQTWFSVQDRQSSPCCSRQ